MTNKTLSSEHKHRIALSHLGKERKPFSEQTREKMRLAHLGKPHPNKSHLHTQEAKDKIRSKKLGVPRSEETKKKISESLKGEKHPLYGKRRSLETRMKMSESRKGEKSHFWKGGVNKINLVIRGSLKYSLWRECVFARDDYTCQICFKRGGKLEADHIKKFSDYPELRFTTNNGLTLCRKCHAEIENPCHV